MEGLLLGGCSLALISARVPHLDVRRPPVVVAAADLALRAAVGVALGAAAARAVVKASFVADLEVVVPRGPLISPDDLPGSLTYKNGPREMAA